MDNNEYQTLGMSQHMLREFRAQCNQRQADAQQRQHTPPDYPRYADELLQYPIFTNHTCPNHTATELLKGVQEEQCQRWRFFFTPDPKQLPHESQWLAMNQQLAMLKHQYRTATSPRLAALAAAVLSIILLVMRGHFLLPAIPILMLSGYWYHSGRHLRQARHRLIGHLETMQRLSAQVEQFQHQLDSLPPPATPEHLQQRYQTAVETLFRNTLSHVLRPHEIGDLSRVLGKQRWQGFITESWGHLQLPLNLPENAQISPLLLDEANTGLAAMQNAAHGRKGDNIFRVQYLNLCILTQRGLLLGFAYYDRVMDEFLYEQHLFHPYQHITEVSFTEQTLPNHATLKQWLPDNVYRHYFHAPVTVLSIHTQTGKHHTCAALPTSPRPLWRDLYGLDNDTGRLSRHLRERVYGLNAEAA